MKLSVALATFNGERFLPDQLASIREQTRLPDELIVCDDASTDSTVSLLREFAAIAPFPARIHINPTNLGSTKNFEQAIRLGTGDVIAPCDQDDRWLPHKLERIEREFQANPAIGMVFSDAGMGTDALAPTNRTVWQTLGFTPRMQRDFDAGTGAKHLLRFNVVSGATMAFRADFRDWVLPIPEAWIHDAWIAFLVASVTEVRTIPEPLIVYRQHDSQQVGIARRTLWQQFRKATRHIDANYFTEIADRFSLLWDRLETTSTCAILEALREKIAFTRSQASMRSQSRIPRIATATRHLVHGRYHRFAHGWRSYAVDVCLPFA